VSFVNKEKKKVFFFFFFLFCGCSLLDEDNSKGGEREIDTS